MQLGSATRTAGRLRARFAALKPAWPKRFGWRGADFAVWLRNNLEAELAERVGFHWLAVAFGTGALFYFAAPREPLASALFGAFLVFASVALASYWRGVAWRTATLIAVILAGASVAKLRVDLLDAPEIARPVFAHLSGRVIDRESRVDFRPRIVLDEVRSEAIPAEAMPDRIRLTVAESRGLPPLGTRVALNARLMPVPGPVVPGGYDAHRAAFFDGIGGSGFVLGGWTIEAEAAGYTFDLAVAAVRAAIVQRILAAQPGEAGAVAAALLVGERSVLSQETNDSLRISGLFHILSISGLHMMLIAGTTFMGVRALLALSPSLALQRPIRKWAALAALMVLTCYFTLSGGGAATVRAYVMAIIMFAAMLVNRPAISMRNLAIAAFIVVALEPEGVVEPGFQMSFAAVAALIAAWEFWRDHRSARLTDDNVIPGYRFLRLAGAAVLGVAVTTLVAGSATAPFAAYHFERVATYSLLGNLLAAPLVSAIIMPFGLLTLAVMPFGLEAVPLAVMAWGIDMLLSVSHFVATLPGAEIHAPPMAAVSLLLVTTGFLWLCLWRRAWRLLGLPAIIAGLALVPLLIDPADILVSPEGTAVAVRDRSGALRVSGARAGSYAVEQFFDEEGGPPDSSALLREGVRCDEWACVLTGANGTGVSHVRNPAAFAEDCSRVAVVATALAAPVDCRAALVIDRERLARFGAHAVRIDGDGSEAVFRVTTARSATPRPWQVRAQALSEAAGGEP
jgi:competence protein ComEC